MHARESQRIEQGGDIPGQIAHCVTAGDRIAAPWPRMSSRNTREPAPSRADKLPPSEASEWVMQTAGPSSAPARSC